MRLHRLEVTAFGPFAEEQVVDFDALGADGLFLLHGETGAGKTTVLDAISFALFGVVPGARQEARRLRSDHACAGQAPRIVLEVTIGGEHLRLTRSPEWDRPKRRGNGSTRESAKATLARRNGGGWVEVATRIPEVAQRVTDLLGLTSAQFFQVALLPQGEFAQFLRAAAEERGKLLERLFGVERYAAVEAWFGERRRRGTRELERADAAIDQLIARIAEAASGLRGAALVPADGGSVEPAADVLPAAEPPLGAADPERLDWADRWVLAARTIAAAAESAAADADAIVTQRRTLLDELTATKALQQRRGKAVRQQAEVDAARPDYRRQRSELRAARRAAPLRPYLERVEDLSKELIAAEGGLTAARAGLAAWDADLGRHQLDLFGSDRDAPVDPGALRAEARTLRDQVVTLTALLDEERALREERRQLSLLVERSQVLDRRSQRLDRERAAVPDLVAAVQSELDRARSAAQRLEHLRATLADAQARAEAADRLPTAHKALAVAATRRAQAVDDHQAAVDDVQTLLRRRLDGMAAELAGGLSSGRGCPVCGATEHPAPAVGTPDQVTAEQVTAAEMVAGRAEQARRRAEATEAEADRTVTALLAVLGGRGPEQAQAEFIAKAEETALVRRLTARLPDAERDLAKAKAAEEDLARQATALVTEQAEMATVLSTVRAAVAERTARLTSARGDDQSIQDRIGRLAATASAAEALVEAEAHVERCRADLREAERAATAAVRGAGFEAPDEVAGALRDDATIGRLELHVDTFAVKEESARLELAHPDLAGLDPDPVDLGPATLALSTALSTARTAVAGVARIGHAGQALERLRSELIAEVEQIRPVRERHERLTLLADLVEGRGQNSKRMTLRSFVLAARLEEVAVAASARLDRMSAGRYSFVHSDAVGPHGVRGGLGLDVVDAYTGQVRSARTLSGGETFMASLALALGLADVVGAEAGAAQLDTLFVDEGFGSLDGEALDAVMGVLDDLRAGGRVVGLVSHVDELRTRIGSRLRVRRGRTGSTLEIEA